MKNKTNYLHTKDIAGENRIHLRLVVEWLNYKVVVRPLATHWSATCVHLQCVKNLICGSV